MRTNSEINKSLEYVFDEEGPNAALDLGDSIVYSVLAMREGGVRHGVLSESHEEWIKRLIASIRTEKDI